jgi:DNA modification methylase
VCKQIHRHFIAFEIDPAIADIARKRLQTVQPVLFPSESVRQMPLEGVSA